MSEYAFNGLSPAEAERLALLAEECGECIQAIGKILRHGYESTHPDGGPTNREMLEDEMGDIKAAYLLMLENMDLRSPLVQARTLEKRLRVIQYLHHNGISAISAPQDTKPVAPEAEE